MGWNMALQLTEEGGATLEASFDWWVAAARRAIEGGWAATRMPDQEVPGLPSV